MIIINLRGVSTKLYFNLNITMPTYKEFITKQNLYYAYFKNNFDLGFEYSLACYFNIQYNIQYSLITSTTNNK